MKSILFIGSRVLLTVAILMMGGVGFAREKTGFKESAYFKAYIGEWEMSGELKGSDGNVIKIKETWKAEFLGDNTLNIEGVRELNGTSQNFVWTLTHNPTTGLYEATHKGSADSADTQHFEISLSETEMKMELTALLGSNNSKIYIVDAFPEKDLDTLESKITVSDDTGATTLSGALTHKRVKKP